MQPEKPIPPHNPKKRSSSLASFMRQSLRHVQLKSWPIVLDGKTAGRNVLARVECFITEQLAGLRMTNVRKRDVAGENEIRLVRLGNARFFDAFDFNPNIHRNLLVRM